MIAPSSQSARKLDCPACGGSLEVRAAGYTTTLACRYCGSVIDVATPEARLIAEYHHAVAEMAIPLGTRGTLQGVEWEAIGWQQRSVPTGESWEEFLLFNPYAGYRWLVLDQGEWTFGRALVEQLEMLSGEVVRWQGKGWEIDDAPLTLTTNRVVGEFYWRIKVGEAVTGVTFWSGQHQLSLERNADEENWTLLEPVDARHIRGAFSLDGGDPGPAPTSPPARPGFVARFFARSSDGMMLPTKMMALAMVSCAVLALAMVIRGGNEGIVQKHIDVTIDAPEKTIALGPITVRRGHAVIEIESNGWPSDLLNNYIDLDYRLVDHATQSAVVASTTIENYPDADSEDSPYKSTVTIAGVPRGTYDLLVDAAGHKSGSQSTTTPAAAPANPWAIDGNGTVGVEVGVTVGAFPVGIVVMAVLLLILPAFGVAAWKMMRDKA